MIASRRTAPTRVGGLAALASVALILAACGGSSSSGSTSAASAAPASSSASAGGTTIGVAQASSGMYLTGPSGHAIYLWKADTGDKSTCSGACASEWPPLTVSGSPSAASGVSQSDLGTITRTDGTKQVTYDGHPLYYFAGDSSASATAGEGSNSFGASWWLVAPSGSPVTSSSGGASSSAASSSAAASAPAAAAPAASSSGSSDAGGGWS
jgi:predicted lipoprotein with Yx(FWY)xxD motif